VRAQPSRSARPRVSASGSGEGREYELRSKGLRHSAGLHAWLMAETETYELGAAEHPDTTAIHLNRPNRCSMMISKSIPYRIIQQAQSRADAQDVDSGRRMECLCQILFTGKSRCPLALAEPTRKERRTRRGQPPPRSRLPRRRESLPRPRQ